MTELPTPAVHTAVKILDLLSSESQPLSLSEISRRIGAPKSTVSRTLSTLHSTRLVDLDGQVYQLGPKLLEYSVAYARNLDITRVFSRVSLEIVAQINETMQLARLEGGEAVFIAKTDCAQLVRPATYIGRRVALHASAVGKLLLAFNPAKLEHLPAITPYTITNQKALTQELERIRTRGYADTKQESALNLCCIAAPVRDSSGAVVAALSVCMASANTSAARFEVALEHSLIAARAISENLGFFASVPIATPPNSHQLSTPTKTARSR